MDQIITDAMPAEAYWALTAKTPDPEAIDTGLRHEPGIYFGMPEAEYHAIPALSASGIKNLMISNMDFWAQSWLNPNYEGMETSALALGSGYGVRICEGRDAFYERYTYAFDKGDYPDALDTAEDVKAALKALAVDGLSKLKKDGLVAKLLEADPDAQILDNLRSEYGRANAGKEFLKAEQIKEIEIAARMIAFDPEASKCFSGGYPEVVIIWIDPETGVPMKARLDYLKIKAIIDLKSFSNPQGKSLNNAVAAAMASRKYHVQAANYSTADRHAVRFARQGRVFGKVDAEWIKAYAEEPEERRFYFVWQQTGIAPVTRVKEFSTVLETFKIGEIVIKEAQQRFAQCFRHYGSDPWLDVKPIEQFEDVEFPLYMMEI